MSFSNKGVLRFLRKVWRYSSRDYHDNYRVLGIETSCDDTAVSLVDSSGRIYYSSRLSDENAIHSMGGVHPLHSAQHHRACISGLIDDCVEKCRIRLSDLDAVAVSSRPGMVLSLKVGVDTALFLAREYRLKFIPIHHMRAHAIVSRLLYCNLHYPFLCLLISGGHSLVVLVEGASSFKIIGESLSGSPGECLDKLARRLGLQPTGSHYARTLEKAALSADRDGYRKYVVPLPVIPKADFNFHLLKGMYYNLFDRYPPSGDDVPNACASIQFSVMAHLCQKLDAAFQFIDEADCVTDWPTRNLVVAGGVAANFYFVKCITHLAQRYGYRTLVPPARFCTDNGEMVAWLGMELLLSNSPDIINPDNLPYQYYVQNRESIGISLREQVRKKALIKFRPELLHKEIFT